jgi:DNA processing protein
MKMGWGKGHEILLTLMLSERLKPSRLSAFLASRSLEALEAAGVETVARNLGLADDDLGAVLETAERAQGLAADLARGGFGITARCDPAYPALLKEIANPPPLLFTRGSLSDADRRAVAIVGSRRPSLAGTRLAGELGHGLAGLGFTIVSGLARGIDTAAHRGALEAGGRTIAVLGSGIDVVYPAENAGLADRIAASGALISELAPGSQPLRPHFPRRNRLISGLALGTVVVEAGEKSGALITAGFALDQNRTVFAVPGSPGEARSRGANRLLKEGAKLVETVDDVLEDLGPQLGWTDRGLDRQAMAPSSAGPAAGVPSSLPPDEMRLITLLSDAPAHVDELARSLKMEAHKVLGLLLSLETRGFARSLAGKFYVKGGLG